MARAMNTFNCIGRGRGEISPRVMGAIAVVVVVILAAIYLFMAAPEPEPIPEPSRPIETVAPAESAEERGDTARDIIDELSSGDDAVDYAEAYERARTFNSDGRFADAQLLYFFAARGGHAPAAFDLATFNDPNHFLPESGLLDKPDPFQALRWYRQAQDTGHALAGERLAKLHTWAKKAAADGDIQAEQLLLQWE